MSKLKIQTLSIHPIVVEITNKHSKWFSLDVYSDELRFLAGILNPTEQIFRIEQISVI